MTSESVVRIKVLRYCFLKLSNATGYVNNTFDHFWFLDTLQITITTVSTFARIALSPEKFSTGTYPQIIIAVITVVRLILLSIFCGDASDEVKL